MRMIVNMKSMDTQSSFLAFIIIILLFARVNPQSTTQKKIKFYNMAESKFTSSHDFELFVKPQCDGVGLLHLRNPLTKSSSGYRTLIDMHVKMLTEFLWEINVTSQQ